MRESTVQSAARFHGATLPWVFRKSTVTPDGTTFNAGDNVPEGVTDRMIRRWTATRRITLAPQNVPTNKVRKPRKKKDAQKRVRPTYEQVVERLLSREKNPLTQEQLTALESDLEQGADDKGMLRTYKVAFVDLAVLREQVKERAEATPQPEGAADAAPDGESTQPDGATDATLEGESTPEGAPDAAET